MLHNRKPSAGESRKETKELSESVPVCELYVQQVSTGWERLVSLQGGPPAGRCETRSQSGTIS